MTSILPGGPRPGTLPPMTAGREVAGDGLSLAAEQLPRTRRPADRRALRPAHARHLVWEWGLNGLAESTELLVSELDQRRDGHRRTRGPSGGTPAVVQRQRASPHRSLGCRPAATSTRRSQRRRHTRPSRRGRARVVPGGGAECPLRMVPHPGARPARSSGASWAQTAESSKPPNPRRRHYCREGYPVTSRNSRSRR